MDSQLKKGLLELCVLAALKEEDSYGYKIIDDVKVYIEISESTLYPILKRLESNKLVLTYSEEHNGRLRKYYKITDLGKEKLKDSEQDWQQIKKVYKFILRGESYE